MKCIISEQDFSLPAHSTEIRKKFGYPDPVISFQESMRIKMAHRNYMHLYKRSCDLTGKSIISIFPPDSKFKVYDKTEWFSDKWDPMDYSRSFDYSKNFFPQFAKLLEEVPVLSLQNINTENSEFCNSVQGVKDCYLAVVAYNNCQDVYYSFVVFDSKDIYYTMYCHNSELCFYCSHIQHCYSCIALDYCMGCQDCLFSYSLENCKNCIFSSNLQNKEFYIFNKQVSKNDYQKFKEQLNYNSVSGLQKCLEKFEQVKLKAIHRASYLVGCDNCTGNDLTDCHNCINTFVAHAGEDVYDSIHFTGPATNCFRSFGFTKTNNCYEIVTSVDAQDCSFTLLCYNTYDCHYSSSLYHCKYCFGCVGLRNKEYCIFNKQYSKEQYQIEKAKLIEHMKSTKIDDQSYKAPTCEWGQFLPVKYSYFPFNISFSQSCFPLDQEEAIRRGYVWKEERADESKKLPIYVCPDLISDIKEDLNKEALRCSRTKKYFNITPKVIRKFKEQNIAIQIEHPVEYMIRKSQETRFVLEARISSKSGVKIDTVYTEKMFPIIYSEEEYRAFFS